MAEKKDATKKEEEPDPKQTKKPEKAVDVKPAGNQPRDQKAEAFEPGVEG